MTSGRNCSLGNACPKLRLFTKLTAFSTLFLIFAGGMVTSTGSGLAVPDWPLSYGMVFPPMVGGVFYEHGHRMIASLVGFLTLIQTIWIWRVETRRWVKVLAGCSLFAVILQGVLGGLTVLFFLPMPISAAHATLGQTFFVLTILVAYSQSKELTTHRSPVPYSPAFFKKMLVVIACLYLQLILGAVMRHWEAGLAIYDFPTHAGHWIPQFNEAMLNTINQWRFEHNLDFVQMHQVVAHFLHRVGALLVFTVMGYVIHTGVKSYKQDHLVYTNMLWLTGALLLQVMLGIFTVLSHKAPVITSLHVAVGAMLLGLTVLLTLRVSRLGQGASC